MSDFTVTVTNPERAAEWTAVFGTTTMAVLWPVPHRANLPGIGEAWVYELDLDELTAEQHARLIAHIAVKFDFPAHEVARDLHQVGVPVLASDCLATIHNPQKWIN